MKKFLFPLLAVMLVGVMTSCDDYYIAQNLTQTHEYQVSASQWITKDGLGYYYAPFQNADITSDIEKYGMVTAYVYDDGRWNPLPYVYPYLANDVDANGQPIQVTVAENIRFDWTTNEVTFIVQDLDGGMPADMRNFPTLTFKVCVLQ